jgi:hypothetical protein
VLSEKDGWMEDEWMRWMGWLAASRVVVVAGAGLRENESANENQTKPNSLGSCPLLLLWRWPRGSLNSGYGVRV